MNKLRKDLKNCIYGYLNDLDKIHVYYSTQELRKNLMINKGYLKVLKFLIKIKTFEIDYYVNLYHEEMLTDLIFRKFEQNVSEYSYSDIVNALSSYFMFIYHKHNKNKIYLKINNLQDLIRWKDLLIKLKDYDFIYYLDEMNIRLSETDNSYMLIYKQLFDCVKSINILNKHRFSVFKFFKELETELYFEELIIKSKTLSEFLEHCIGYFKKFPNHIKSLHVHLDSSSINNDDELLCSLIQLNKLSLKKLKVINEKVNYKLYDTIRECANLEELSISNPNSNEYNPNVNKSLLSATLGSKSLSNIFCTNSFLLEAFTQKRSLANIKQVGGFKIYSKELEKFTIIFNKLYNLESITELKLEFNCLNKINTLFSFFPFKVLKYLSVEIPIFYEDTHNILKVLQRFNLSYFGLTYSHVNSLNFSIDNICNFVDLDHTFHEGHFEFIMRLMRNNLEVKKYNIKTYDNQLFSNFVNYLAMNKAYDIISKINNIHIFTTHNNINNERRITKALNKINSLTIRKSFDYKSFKDVKLLKHLILDQVSPVNEDFFDFLKIIRLKTLIILQDDTLKSLKFIAKNVKYFKNLTFLKISNKYVQLKDIELKMINQFLKFENLIYFGINVALKNSKCEVKTINELIQIKLDGE